MVNQQKYEAKKALLKRIRDEWHARLTYERKAFYSKTPLPPNPSKLDYGGRLLGYMSAREKLRRFIRESLFHVRLTK